MSIILGAFAKGSDLAFPAVEEIRRHLPDSTRVEIKRHTLGSSMLVVAKYGAQSDQETIHDPDGSVFALSGIIDEVKKAEAVGVLRNPRSISPDDFPQGFCAVGVTASGIVGMVSGPGTDQLFSFCDDRWIVITNRHNLVVPFMEQRPSVSPHALALMASQKCVRDYITYFEEVLRTPPATVLASDGERIRAFEPSSAEWARDLSPGDVVDRLSHFSSYYCAVAENRRRIRLSLSGGKDSRAILGMLLPDDRIEYHVDVNTFGEPYAPDVMAAQDVAKICEVFDHKRSAGGGNTLVGGNRISWDLWVDSAGTSLADIQGMYTLENLQFGGHEIGFKRNPNRLQIDEYLRLRESDFRRPNLVGDTTSLDRSIERFVCRTERALEGVPVGRYESVDLQFNHIALHTSSSITTSHVRGYEVHPLVDRRALQILVGVNDELMTAQFIHYVLMRGSTFPLELVPFAGDRWPKSLVDIAAGAGIPFRGDAAAPYMYEPFFPAQRRRGMYPWRTRLMSRASGFMQSYIHDCSEALSFLDHDYAAALLQRDSRVWSLSDLYELGNLLKICLVHYFGIDAWRIDRRASIEAEIDELLVPTSSRASLPFAYSRSSAPDSEGSTEGDPVEQVGAALAESVRVLRDSRPDYAAVYTALSEGSLDLEQCRSIFKGDFRNLSAHAESSGVIIYSGPAGDAPESVDYLTLSSDTTGHHMLLSIEGVAPGSLKGFNWSEAGRFYFQYLTSNLGSGRMTTTIRDRLAGLRRDEPISIWLRAWYPKTPLYFGVIHTSRVGGSGPERQGSVVRSRSVEISRRSEGRAESGVADDVLGVLHEFLMQNETDVSSLPQLNFPAIPSGPYGRALPEVTGTQYWSDMLRKLSLPPKARVLEYGCGNSSLRRTIEGLGLTWSGLDISDSMEATARRDTTGITYYDGRIIPFDDETFDAVISVQVFEHVYDPGLALGEISRVLRRGGYLVGSTSFLEAYHSDSTYTYSPSHFCRLIEQSGMDVVVVSPGIDGFALLMRRLVRAFGGRDEAGSWPFFRHSSPLNRLIEQCGLRQGVSAQQVNALKLELAGHFHFLAQRPEA